MGVPIQGIDGVSVGDVLTNTITLAALSGASVSTSGLIPAGAIVLGVTGEVTVAVTGATSFDVGDPSKVNLYADDVAPTLGTTWDSTSPTASPLLWTKTALEATLVANGGNFTGGSVEITAHYILPS